jgi:peptide/nickel transport system permease protein
MVFLVIRLYLRSHIGLFVPGDLATLTRIKSPLFGMNLTDKSLFEQYCFWIWDILHGDWGKSIFYHEDVSELIKERLPISLNISLVAFVLNIPLR